MKTLLLVVLMTTVAAFGQDLSFIEPGQTYFIAGDRDVTDLLAEQDLVVEVDAVVGDWIRVYVEQDGVYAWINASRLSLFIEVDLEEIATTRLTACLQDIATAQERYYVDFDVYADVETLFEATRRPTSCEGIELETVEAAENDYLVVGTLDDFSYQVSASGPVEPTD